MRWGKRDGERERVRERGGGGHKQVNNEWGDE